LFVALYAILIKALFTSTTVFLPLFIWLYQNRQHSAFFSLFGIFWSDLAFFLQVAWHFWFTWPWQPRQWPQRWPEMYFAKMLKVTLRSQLLEHFKRMNSLHKHHICFYKTIVHDSITKNKTMRGINHAWQKLI